MIRLVAHVVAAGAINCGLLGVFPTETDAQAAVDCINRHRDTGTPAVMTQVGLSVDSYMAHGVVVDKQGRLLSFNYDSAPCGGPTCASRFETGPCLSLLIGPPSPARYVGCRPSG